MAISSTGLPSWHPEIRPCQANRRRSDRTESVDTRRRLPRRVCRRTPRWVGVYTRATRGELDGDDGDDAGDGALQVGGDDPLDREPRGGAVRARPLERHGDRAILLDACQLDVPAIRTEARPEVIESRAHARFEERRGDRLNLVWGFS